MKIIVLKLFSENDDTLNASHAILELTPELKWEIGAHVADFIKWRGETDELQSVLFVANNPLFLPIDEQIVSGSPAIQEITDKRMDNIKKFSEMLEISLSACEMKVSFVVGKPAEVRLYMYEKHTGQEIYTEEFPAELLG